MYTRGLTKWGNRILGVLGLVAVTALLLATVSLMWLNREQSAREKQSIRADLIACERLNERGERIRMGFGAVDEAITGVVDEVFGFPRHENAAAVAALRARLDKPLSRLDDAKNSIEIVDCIEAVPGARRLLKETPQ